MKLFSEEYVKLNSFDRLEYLDYTTDMQLQVNINTLELWQKERLTEDYKEYLESRDTL